MFILNESIDVSKFDGLYNAIIKAEGWQLFVLGLIGVLVILAFFVLLLTMTGNLKNFLDLFSKKQNKGQSLDSENWLSSSISKTHKMPESIAFTKKDIDLQMKKYEKDIDILRHQPVSGKTYVFSFTHTKYISTDCINAFIKFAKNGMDKNVVKLVFGFSSHPAKDIKKFKEKCQTLEKRYNNPSFVVKNWED